METLLITGGAGFIGSHVAIRLSKKGYRVIVVDKLDYCSCVDHIRPYTIEFIRGDICDADLMTYILDSKEVDVVMHFAAQTHVDNSFGNSLLFTHNNVYGTHVLLECVKNAPRKIKKFIHVSTDEVYGDAHEQATEEYVLEPSNPYAATKAGAEFIARSYLKSFKVPVIITRGNNVYGPYQYPEKLIAKFIKQCLAGEEMTVHGQGMTRRNFLYVEDVARAFELILEQGSIGEIYNIGGGEEKSVLDIAHAVSSCLHVEPRIRFVEDRPFNDARYSISSEKLRKLGWSEEVSFEDGLKETALFFASNACLNSTN